VLKKTYTESESIAKNNNGKGEDKSTDRIRVRRLRTLQSRSPTSPQSMADPDNHRGRAEDSLDRSCTGDGEGWGSWSPPLERIIRHLPLASCSFGVMRVEEGMKLKETDHARLGAPGERIQKRRATQEEHFEPYKEVGDSLVWIRSLFVGEVFGRLIKNHRGSLKREIENIARRLQTKTL